MGEGAAFGRKVKGVKVYAEDAADYLELLLRAVPAATRRATTSFSTFVNALDADELARFAEPPASRGACDEHVRAVPFYCPFCGEQDIRPDDAGERPGDASRASAVRADRDHGGRCRLMADADPRAPWHEPAMPVLDEEAAWVHEAAERFEDARPRSCWSGRSSASTRSSRSARRAGSTAWC